MAANPSRLRLFGERLFERRGTLLSLWQEVSEHFYPERADFTTVRNAGDELAANLMTSYPVICRRDLGNTLGSYLRPTNKVWAHMGTNRPDWEDTEAKQWLEWAEGLQRNATYDRIACFSRATKEGDHDFASFGQAALSVELNRKLNALLYRSWHLRDVAWQEDETGRVCTVVRRWKPTAADLYAQFGDRVHKRVKDSLKDKPFEEVTCWHMQIPTERYDDLGRGVKIRQPYVSVYFDLDNDHVMEEVGAFGDMYVIPRWATVSGSQYAHSPAVVAALPDARLVQAITRTILTAGEKAVDPPMIGVREALRSDLNIYAGGFTAVDAAYDERLGEVLRPLSIDKSGLHFGIEMVQDIREQLSHAFYRSQLRMPVVNRDMTAYEAAQHVQEFIREALPLFEPVEYEYNGQLCEHTFGILQRHGAFGRPDQMPRRLVGAEIRFSFESPLHEAIEKQKAGQLMEAYQILATTAQADPNAVHQMDIAKATRDVLQVTVPAAWMRSEADVARIVADQERTQQLQLALSAVQQGADAAEKLGRARASMEEAA